MATEAKVIIKRTFETAVTIAISWLAFFSAIGIGIWPPAGWAAGSFWLTCLAKLLAFSAGIIFLTNLQVIFPQRENLK